MNITKLHADAAYDYDFALFGIYSQEQVFRLCWLLNAEMNWNLTMLPAIALPDVKQGTVSEHQLFYYQDKDSFSTLKMVVNKGSNGYLLPDYKQVNYLLLWEGAAPQEQKAKLLQTLKSCPFVIASQEINPETLKFKQNLQFDDKIQPHKDHSDHGPLNRFRRRIAGNDRSRG